MRPPTNAGLFKLGPSKGHNLQFQILKYPETTLVKIILKYTKSY